MQQAKDQDSRTLHACVRMQEPRGHAGCPMSQQPAQRNASFAASERVAFAHVLEGWPQEIDFRDKEDEAVGAHPPCGRPHPTTWLPAI